MNLSQFVPGSLYGPLRRALTPTVAGRVRHDHIALTFDDGPDPISTPLFLDLLDTYRVRASFFLIGERAEVYPEVVTEIAARGHELAVHGWTHTCVMRVRPEALADQVRRTKALLESLGAPPVRWYRPPYGIATTASNQAARGAELNPLLWTAWGRDWDRRASPASVRRHVRRTLRPGGTVLLHDADAYGTPGSWKTTLAAVDGLLEEWVTAGVPVGTATEHLGPR